MNSQTESTLATNQDLEKPTTVPSYWSGVFAMTLCVFTLIASEFMPVSLLTPIAGSLNISEGLAGQGIAISGAFAVITSLFISTLAGNLNRKTLMLLLTVLMGVSGATIGMANSYVSYMLGRALIGMVIGGFWSMSAAIAMRLVPQEKVSKALAIFNGGNAIAMVVAAPLGAYLGSTIGWRGAFLALIPVSIITLIWQWFSLPSMEVESHSGATPPSAKQTSAFQVLALLRQPVVCTGMVAVGIFFMGQFTLYTYVRPFLETATLMNETLLSFTLMLIGIAGFIGTSFINIPLKKSLYKTLIRLPILMAIIAISLTLWGHKVGVVIGLLSLWGMIATAAPVGWWTWIAKTFPTNAESGGGLMVAVVQLSIALGSTLGGILFDHYGFESSFMVSAVLLVVAALLANKVSKI